tara:strand:+ start:1925 stop:2311 length:387 start_codon:yes stop_codon:yes gene_type:complete
MKILGIGVDIVENKRIKSLIKNNTFTKRSFSNREIKLSKGISNKTNYFAKRFAAKESLVKSLGTGFRNGINLKDIEIFNDKIGKPYFSKSNKIDNIVYKRFRVKKYNLFLSISDEKDYSIAFTILQTK